MEGKANALHIELRNIEFDELMPFEQVTVLRIAQRLLASGMLSAFLMVSASSPGLKIPSESPCRLKTCYKGKFKLSK